MDIMLKKQRMLLSNYLVRFHDVKEGFREHGSQLSEQLRDNFVYTYERELQIVGDVSVERINRVVFLLTQCGVDLVVTNLAVPPRKYTRRDLFYLVTNLGMMRTSSVATPENEWLFRVNGEFVDFRPTRTVTQIVPNADLDLVL
jgi:hypothetical protein